MLSSTHALKHNNATDFLYLHICTQDFRQAVGNSEGSSTLPLPLYVLTVAAKLQTSSVKGLFILPDQLTSCPDKGTALLSFILMWHVSIIRGPIKAEEGGKKRSFLHLSSVKGRALG